jgi:CDP-glucose 4,6-dehydratase
MGTANVLDALRGLDSVRVVVAVTTDKVYNNREWVNPYREDDALGGHDPYSASKAASEMVITSYRKSFLEEQGVAVASARAGNVIGGGDWSQDRLIPDAMRAWSSGEILHIRRPESTRPWQHVLEPLTAYLRLAEQIWLRPELAGAYNIGPLTHEAVTVRELVQMVQSSFGSGKVSWGEIDNGPHEAGWLSLETSKARVALGVQPYWHLSEAICRTVQWYRQHGEGADGRKLCEADITAFEATALLQNKSP